MFEFTEAVEVATPPAHAWDVLRDIDDWWLESNPEHQSLEHLDTRSVTEVGAALRIREKIGGIPGEAVGTITAVEPGTAVSWEAEARYRWVGVSVHVREGVTWRVEPRGAQACTVSATVWAQFPRTTIGRAASFAFERLLGGIEKDRAHARAELLYLKKAIEGQPRPVEYEQDG
ncbi:SRPBCC family protein [Mycolicibacterium aichiense]|uniref:SRPBCC family protein n=1 Tax=Mycolicibacterium aichiense TaxID=1799 RepID=UPI003D671527